jgi:shikimate dehydrogenase
MSLEAFAVPSPTGATRLYAIVGNPMEQVMAPSLMNRLFVGRNVDALLVPIKAETSSLATVAKG